MNESDAEPAGRCLTAGVPPVGSLTKPEDLHHLPKGRSRQEHHNHLGATLAEASRVGIATGDYRTLIVETDR
jgi:hypothetical protein